MPFCTECGSRLSPADQMCAVCGTPTQPVARTDATVTMSAAATAPCAACGHTLISSNKFCARCGTPQKPRMEETPALPPEAIPVQHTPIVVGTPCPSATKVSSKYAFAVVALCGLVAFPLLIIGTASPVYEGIICSDFSTNLRIICSPTLKPQLLDIAKDATCDSGKARGASALAFGIIAAAAALVGTLVSAVSPFSTKPNLPVIGGAILGFGSLCALIAGAIAINLYEHNTCFGKSPSSVDRINIGPAPILLMLGVLPQAVAFIAALVMKQTGVHPIKYDAATNGVKGPAAAMMVLSISTLALLTAAGLTKVYDFAAGPTLLHAAKHGTCKTERIRGTVALVCLIATGIGAGAGLILGYSALVTGSRRFITYGGIVLCGSGALALIGGPIAISLSTTTVCFGESLKAAGGSVGPSGILLLVSAFVLLFGSAATHHSARSSSLQAENTEELGFQPLPAETAVPYQAMQGKESDQLLPHLVD